MSGYLPVWWRFVSHYTVRTGWLALIGLILIESTNEQLQYRWEGGRQIDSSAIEAKEWWAYLVVLPIQHDGSHLFVAASCQLSTGDQVPKAKWIPAKPGGSCSPCSNYGLKSETWNVISLTDTFSHLFALRSKLQMFTASLHWSLTSVL